jgi:hypothetical protein
LEKINVFSICFVQVGTPHTKNASKNRGALTRSETLSIFLSVLSSKTPF